MSGIYIHIPFCKQRCRYCAFYSTTLHALHGSYTAALCRELEQRKGYAGNKPVETIYLGGGTPSLLAEEHLAEILKSIHCNYRFATNPEITIECNPDDLTPAYAEMLARLGFNRISMGVQSFCDEQLRRLGRRHTAEGAREAVHNARVAGFRNISIDLMFALPGSTREQWAADLCSAIELRPEHLSAYNLTYEEGTPLYRALQKGEITELSEEENIAQFNMLIEQMRAAGYHHYEISNFARPGHESRHNSSYWHDIPYIGLGAGAHSYDGTSRGWNIADVAQYIKGINCGTPVFEIENLTTEEQYNDAVLTRLRTADGLPTEWVKKKFGDTLYNYMMLAARKEIATGNLQEKPNGNLALTPKGIFVSDAVIREFIYV